MIVLSLLSKYMFAGREQKGEFRVQDASRFQEAQFDICYHCPFPECLHWNLERRWPSNLLYCSHSSHVWSIWLLNNPSLPGLSWAFNETLPIQRWELFWNSCVVDSPGNYLFWSLDSPAYSCWIVFQKPSSPESLSLDSTAPLLQ